MLCYDVCEKKKMLMTKKKKMQGAVIKFPGRKTLNCITLATE